MHNSQKQIKVHPAAELFPMMSEEELQGLANDIKEHGLRESIVLWHDGTLLDGRNRLEACKRANVEPDFAQFDHDTEYDPIEYVLTHNLHRRHLSPSQKAMVAVKLKELLEPEAKGNSKANLKRGNEKPDVEILPPREKSRDRAAASVGVSGKLVDAAEKVQKQGVQELKQAVVSGKVSVSNAAEAARLPPEQQMAKAMEPRKERSEKPALQIKIEECSDKLLVARWLFDSCSEIQRSQISVAWSDWWNE